MPNQLLWICSYIHTKISPEALCSQQTGNIWPYTLKFYSSEVLIKPHMKPAALRFLHECCRTVSISSFELPMEENLRTISTESMSSKSRCISTGGNTIDSTAYKRAYQARTANTKETKNHCFSLFLSTSHQQTFLNRTFPPCFFGMN